jgi:D-3-phosphoglycerate dehydrogenase / 2-oxoglutarate reductase
MHTLIVEPRGFPSMALDNLRRLGTVELNAEEGRAGLLARARSAEILWIRLGHRVDQEVMNSAPQLKLIASPTTGLDHIELEEAERRNIRVISLRGETRFLETVRATAEHTLALTLALLRRIPAATGHVSRGGWDRDRFQGRELYGKVVGVVGYGRLGSIVARYMRAFEARVLATDPAVRSESVGPEISLVSLNELLYASDVVTLHVPLGPAMMGLFGRSQFQAMKPGAWFVNTSRGGLVDESALLEALVTGRLAGAALDVLADEPEVDPGSVLIRYARENENLIITPHLGGCTLESMEKTEVFLSERVCAALLRS